MSGQHIENTLDSNTKNDTNIFINLKQAEIHYAHLNLKSKAHLPSTEEEVQYAALDFHSADLPEEIQYAALSFPSGNSSRLENILPKTAEIILAPSNALNNANGGSGNSITSGTTLVNNHNTQIQRKKIRTWLISLAVVCVCVIACLAIVLLWQTMIHTSLKGNNKKKNMYHTRNPKTKDEQQEIFQKESENTKIKAPETAISVVPAQPYNQSTTALTIQTCKEVQQQLLVKLDGHYCLKIPHTDDKKRRTYIPAKVYCSGMNSVNPKEFLSLEVGEEENYAFSWWSGTEYIESLSGTAYFNKVALNISSQEIIADDYTFARIENKSGKKKTAYSPQFGKAMNCKGCYSGKYIGKCKINLRGTVFHLSPAVQYTAHGYEPCMEQFYKSESGQEIEVTCGGWCGWCAPDGYDIMRPRINFYINPSLDHHNTYC